VIKGACHRNLAAISPAFLCIQPCKLCWRSKSFAALQCSVLSRYPAYLSVALPSWQNWQALPRTPLHADKRVPMPMLQYMHTASAHVKLGQQQLCGRTPRRDVLFASCNRTPPERQRPFSLTQQRHSRISAANEFLSVGFYTAAAAGLLYSATPLLTGKSKEENQGKSDNYGETDADPEGIKWGVMSVVSFIPLFNWTVHSLVHTSRVCAVSGTALWQQPAHTCRLGCLRP